jgi:hypothetical protein
VTSSVVVAFATTPPRRSAVNPQVADIAARGGEILLGCWFDPAILTIPAEIRETRMIGGSAAPRSGSAPRQWWTRLRGSDVETEAEKDPATRRWLQARVDAWVVDSVARADFLVAVDQDAVYPVWELARAHPDARAAFGFPAVTAALAGRLTLSDGRGQRRGLPGAELYAGTE